MPPHSFNHIVLEVAFCCEDIALKQKVARFFPHDSMLARYLLSSHVCLSDTVQLSPACIVSEQLNTGLKNNAAPLVF